MVVYEWLMNLSGNLSEYHHCFKFSFQWLYLLQQISKFELVSDYAPTGDQPQAIDALVEGVDKKSVQTLLGVTGSGKTF